MAPSVKKNLMSRAQPYTNSSEGFAEALAERRHLIPSGYEHAGPIGYQTGYVGATPVEEMRDENGNIVSDGELEALLKKFLQDPGCSPKLPSVDTSSKPSSSSSSPSTYIPYVSVLESAPTRGHGKVIQKVPRGIVKGNKTYALNSTDESQLDRSHDEGGDTSSQLPGTYYETSIQYPEARTRATLRQSLPDIRRPSSSVAPHPLAGNGPSSEMQTQAERVFVRENIRDRRGYRPQPSVRSGSLDEMIFPDSVSRHDGQQTSPQVLRSSQAEPTRNQRAPTREDAKSNYQCGPPLNEYSQEVNEESDPALADALDGEQTGSSIDIEKREINGELQFLVEGHWKMTVSLHTIRAEILAQEKLKGTYVHAWSRGKDKGDETSYHPWYVNWGWERHQRPAILFQLDRNGYQVPSRHLEIWIYQGRVVLDTDNNPIELWPEIPLLCSSKMAGAELEAIVRTNPNIPLAAIRARMPPISKVGTIRGPPDLNVLRMRMGRFRRRAGLIAWNEREGSRQIKQELISILGPRCVQENSTWSFGRDLTRDEIDRVDAVNRGTAPQRGRKKRPAEPDDQSLDSTSPKRQNTSLDSLLQERPARQIQAARFGTISKRQASPRQQYDIVPSLRGQKRRRGQSDLDAGRHDLSFPPSKRPYAGPEYGQEGPYTRLSQGQNFSASRHRGLPAPEFQYQTHRHGRQWTGGLSEVDEGDVSPIMKRLDRGPGYNHGISRKQHIQRQSESDLDEVSSHAFTSFAPLQAQKHKQNRGSEGAKGKPDHHNNEEYPRPSTRWSKLDMVDPRSNRGAESNSAVLYNSSQIRARASPHESHALDDDIQFVGSRARGLTMQPSKMMQSGARQNSYRDSMSAAPQRSPTDSQYRQQYNKPRYSHTHIHDDRVNERVPPFETHNSASQCFHK